MNCWLRELAYVPWDSETEVFPARHRCSLEHGADELRPCISSEIRVRVQNFRGAYELFIERFEDETSEKAPGRDNGHVQIFF